MELPIYAIVADRPVKAERTPDGGMVLSAFNWETGDFEPDGSYLTRIFTPYDETDFVTQRVFEAKVAKLRAQIHKAARGRELLNTIAYPPRTKRWWKFW